ncbi:MAG: cation:proton antiporter [Verrucomicrobiota bacterium]|jgi:multicomponent Na+:H+ antiporter subunit F|nr:cation:proton antiporter [Verrucomicrobiota bacterium]
MTGLFLFAAAWMGVLMLAVLWRLFRGPTVPDRAVALDAVNTLVVASMILCAAILRETVFVDVAIVYALLAYVGTLYIARAMRGGR